MKKVKKSVRVKVKKTVKSKPKKDTGAYFECLKACCQKGIKPKRISEVAHECKSNALAINKRMSATKAKAVKKIKEGYAKLGQGLSEFIK